MAAEGSRSRIMTTLRCSGSAMNCVITAKFERSSSNSPSNLCADTPAGMRGARSVVLGRAALVLVLALCVCCARAAPLALGWRAWLSTFWMGRVHQIGKGQRPTGATVASSHSSASVRAECTCEWRVQSGAEWRRAHRARLARPARMHARRACGRSAHAGDGHGVAAEAVSSYRTRNLPPRSGASWCGGDALGKERHVVGIEERGDEGAVLGEQHAGGRIAERRGAVE